MYSTSTFLAAQLGVLLVSFSPITITLRSLKGPRAGARVARGGRSQVLRGVRGRAAGRVRAARRQGPLRARALRPAARLYGSRRDIRESNEGGPRAAHREHLARRLPHRAHRNAPRARTHTPRRTLTHLPLLCCAQYSTVQYSTVQCTLHDFVAYTKTTCIRYYNSLLVEDGARVCVCERERERELYVS